VKSGPDVFADALVPCRPQPLPRRSIPKSVNPKSHKSGAWSFAAGLLMRKLRQPSLSAVITRLAGRCCAPPRSWLGGDNQVLGGNGYRFAKWQGKPNSVNARNPRQTTASLIWRRAMPQPRSPLIHRDT